MVIDDLMTTDDPLDSLLKLLVFAIHNAMDDSIDNPFCISCCEWTNSLVKYHAMVNPFAGSPAANHQSLNYDRVNI